MKSKLSLLAASLFAMLLAGAACGMSPESLAVVRQYAEDGNAASQVLLAVAYLNGDGGLARNPAAAARWFEKAAVQGNGYAEARLGDLYEEGLGVARNPKLAFDWREKAANRGNVQAQLDLGRMYLDGRGAAKDAAKGLYWLERAAVEGNAEAQYLLGRLHHLGNEDVAANRGLARQWLDKASLQGSQGAIRFVHWIESVGYLLDETWHKRLPALQKLAEDGDPEAQYQVAQHYEQGSAGMSMNAPLAVQWYQRAAASGHDSAMKALSRIYAQGAEGVAPDPKLAREWAARARAGAN